MQQQQDRSGKAPRGNEPTTARHINTPLLAVSRQPKKKKKSQKSRHATGAKPPIGGSIPIGNQPNCTHRASRRSAVQLANPRRGRGGGWLIVGLIADGCYGDGGRQAFACSHLTTKEEASESTQAKDQTDRQEAGSKARRHAGRQSSGGSKAVVHFLLSLSLRCKPASSSPGEIAGR